MNYAGHRQVTDKGTAPQDMSHSSTMSQVGAWPVYKQIRIGIKVYWIFSFWRGFKGLLKTEKFMEFFP
jgi:hypothetical protein